MAEIQVDADLHFWDIQPESYGGYRGVIMNDRKDRGFDGHIVHTSPVVEELGNGLVRTRSGTVYRLVPREESVILIKRGL